MINKSTTVATLLIAFTVASQAVAGDASNNDRRELLLFPSKKPVPAGTLAYELKKPFSAGGDMLSRLGSHFTIKCGDKPRLLFSRFASGFGTSSSGLTPNWLVQEVTLNKAGQEVVKTHLTFMRAPVSVAEEREMGTKPSTENLIPQFCNADGVPKPMDMNLSMRLHLDMYGMLERQACFMDRDFPQCRR